MAEFSNVKMKSKIQIELNREIIYKARITYILFDAEGVVIPGNISTILNISKVLVLPLKSSNV